MRIDVDLEAVPELRPVLATLTASFRASSGAARAAAVSARGSLDPALAHLDAGRSLFVCDPVGLTRDDATTLLRRAEAVGASVVLIDPWLHAVAVDHLAHELARRPLQGPVLVDARAVGSGVSPRDRHRTAALLHRLFGAVPRWAASVGEGDSMADCGELVIDAARVPARRSLVRNVLSPHLSIRVVLAEGLLRLELPSGDDARPGLVVRTDPAGERRLPQVYRSPRRHGLLRLAEALTAGTPDTATLEEHVRYLDAAAEVRA